MNCEKKTTEDDLVIAQQIFPTKCKLIQKQSNHVRCAVFLTVVAREYYRIGNKDNRTVQHALFLWSLLARMAEQC